MSNSTQREQSTGSRLLSPFISGISRLRSRSRPRQLPGSPPNDLPTTPQALSDLATPRTSIDHGTSSGTDPLAPPLHVNPNIRTTTTKNRPSADITAPRTSTDHIVQRNTSLFMSPPDVNDDRASSLPPGPKRRINPLERTYYIDHNAKATTWDRPSANIDVHGSAQATRATVASPSRVEASSTGPMKQNLGLYEYSASSDFQTSANSITQPTTPPVHSPPVVRSTNITVVEATQSAKLTSGQRGNRVVTMTPGMSFFPNAQGINMDRPVMTDNSVVHNTIELDILRDLKDHYLPSAEYNHESQEPPYQPEIRKDVINAILKWVDSSDNRPICWFYGPAGSGKTTIARSIAEHYDAERRLAGSFFFSRDSMERQDTSKVGTTIAYRLAINYRAIGEKMRQVLEADPTIPAKSSKIQFNQLIVTPVRSSPTSSCLIIIIDALDECNAKDAVNLVKLLGEISHNSPPLIRFFVTGRADDGIRGKFRLYSEKVYVLDLGEFRDDHVIRAFYRNQFARFYEENVEYMHGVEIPWPSDAKLDDLVILSAGLFIHAATVVKFVGDLDHEDANPPAQKLQNVMGRHYGLDDLYKQVLGDAPHHANPAFRQIVLLLLRDPLPIHDLALFLHLTIPEVFLFLRGCRSILRIPEGSHGTITLFHASLRDFLLDSERSGPRYHINSVDSHLAILHNCVQVMTKEWYQKTMWMWDSRNAGRRLVYACENWHYHLGEVIRNDKWVDHLEMHFGEAALEDFLHHIGSNWFRMWAAVIERDYYVWGRLKEDFVVLGDAIMGSSLRIHNLIRHLHTLIECHISGETLQQEHGGLDTKIIALVARLKAVFEDIRQYRQLLQCHGSKAQQLLDTFQTLLGVPWLSKRFRQNLLVATQRLSTQTGLYPACYGLGDVNIVGDHPVASGGFADVYKGRFRDISICLKVPRLFRRSDTAPVLMSVPREAILWSQLSHRNIHPCYGLFEYKSVPCIVFPWMENGNVTSFLEDYPNTKRILLVLDVASGLEYLHSNNIVHGDLKGVNILVSGSGIARIANFGHSSVLDAGLLDPESIVASRGGTIRWQAPELWVDTEDADVALNSKASDVYAFSNVCYEIFAGNIPFFELNRNVKILMEVLDGRRPSRPPASPSWTLWGLTETIWSLMQACWSPYPDQRPTMQEIVIRQHAWNLPVDNRPAENLDLFILARSHDVAEGRVELISVSDLEGLLTLDSSSV